MVSLIPPEIFHPIDLIKTLTTYSWFKLIAIITAGIISIADFTKDLYEVVETFINLWSIRQKSKYLQENADYSPDNQNQTYPRKQAKMSDIWSDLDQVEQIEVDFQCQKYIAWLQFIVLFMAYLFNYFVCLYLTKFNKSQSFNQLRNRLNHQSVDKLIFRIFLLLGFGPCYFLCYEMLIFYQNRPGNGFYQKLFTKDADKFREHAYLVSIMLIRTIYEDIPFLFVYTFKWTRTESIKWNSIIPAYILYNIFKLTKEYFSWILIVTKKNKTWQEKILLFVWNLGYIILGILSLMPVILSFETLYGLYNLTCYHEKEIPCMKQSQINELSKLRFIQNEQDRDHICYLLRFRELFFGFSCLNYRHLQQFKPSILVVRTFVIGTSLRILAAILMSVNKSYKAWKNNCDNLTRREGRSSMVKIENSENLPRLKKRDLLHEIIRNMIVYIFSAPIYLLVPFAGGVYRSFGNATIKSLMYVLIFIQSLSVDSDSISGSSTLVKKYIRQSLFGMDYYKNQNFEEWKNYTCTIPYLNYVVYDNRMFDTPSQALAEQYRRDQFLIPFGYFLSMLSGFLFLLSVYIFNHAKLRDCIMQNDDDYIKREADDEDGQKPEDRASV